MEKSDKLVHIWSKPQFNENLGRLNIDDNNIETLPDVAFISINDTHGQWNESWLDRDHPNVLRLWFDDVENDHEVSSPTNTISVRAFDSEQAQAVVTFVENNRHKKTFIVHCTAGISRSGAVGQFICDYFNCDREEFLRINPHIYPNARVTRMLNNLTNGYADEGIL